MTSLVRQNPPPLPIEKMVPRVEQSKTSSWLGRKVKILIGSVIAGVGTVGLALSNFWVIASLTLAIGGGILAHGYFFNALPKPQELSQEIEGQALQSAKTVTKTSFLSNANQSIHKEALVEAPLPSAEPEEVNNTNQSIPKEKPVQAPLPSAKLEEVSKDELALSTADCMMAASNAIGWAATYGLDAAASVPISVFSLYNTTISTYKMLPKESPFIRKAMILSFPVAHKMINVHPLVQCVFRVHAVCTVLINSLPKLRDTVTKVRTNPVNALRGAVHLFNAASSVAFAVKEQASVWAEACDRKVCAGAYDRKVRPGYYHDKEYPPI